MKRIAAVFALLLALHGEKFFIQLFVKGAGKQGAVRQAERDGAAVHTNAGGAVCTAGCGNTEVDEVFRDAAERACGARRDLRRVHALAAHFRSPLPTFGAALYKFLIIFAVTQIPLAIGEGILTVIIWDRLKAYKPKLLKKLDVLSAKEN